ncbi:MAG: TRAP transporter small permease subunit [Alphaproteobacteria bacterium]
MKLLLGISRIIDSINERIGKLVYWCVLIAVIVSAVNATVRYTLHTSSNLWLELQWYLFAAVFLLCSGYTFLRNEHIRIDIIFGRYSKRMQTWVDILGTLFFLLPMALIIMYLSWPVFLKSLVHPAAYDASDGFTLLFKGLANPADWERSTDSGGLVRWPVKALIPLGFFLLSLQGISEIIKRLAFLMGLIPDPSGKRAHGAEPDATGGAA